MKSQLILSGKIDYDANIAEALGIGSKREAELDIAAKYAFERATLDKTGHLHVFLYLESLAENYNEMLYLCFMVAGHKGFVLLRETIKSSTVRQLVEFINSK